MGQVRGIGVAMAPMVDATRLAAQRKKRLLPSMPPAVAQMAVV